MIGVTGRRLLALLACLVIACAPVAEPESPSVAKTSPAEQPTGGATGEITVFAASSLTDAFQEIGQRYQADHPGSTVTFNFCAPSQLRTQLEQGARADVFASANQTEMDRAKAAGVAGPDRVFARNRVIVIVPKDNPGRIVDLRDLAKPDLRLVTAAPEVPIGVYTQEMLDKMAQDPAYGPEFKDQVNANVVSREPNVRQVVAKVVLGEADAAVVYSSDVTPDVAAEVGTIAVPDSFNTQATYPIAALSNAPNPAGAEAFISYVLSAEGQAILEKWGFLPAG